MKQTTPRPTISAVMPAYNEEAFIAAAIESILSQTFTDWELIIVDDGSTDGTRAVVENFGDARIRYLHQENQGRGAARNTALNAARGTYIAVTDADDISLPHRFEEEVSFLEAHPEVGVLSAQVNYFSGDLPPTTLLTYPLEPAAIRARFARGAMGIAHAACMMRRDVFDAAGPYAEECRQAQDLELFLRIIDRFDFASLPDVLVHYRSDPRTLGFGAWLRTCQFTAYANHRHRCWQENTPPAPFALWHHRPGLWSRLLTWDTLRFVRFKVLCHRRLNQQHPVIELR